MKKRLVVYFHYNPHGRVDAPCRLAVCAMREIAQSIIFVTNGALEPESRGWAGAAGLQLRERENTGFDVGAYREILLGLGQERLAEYDELILMNYTLAGPVGSVAAMFAAMDERPALGFWGLTRHYAMKSRRFAPKGGLVPEHLQSHFLVVRQALLQAPAFWAYWQTMTLPQSYEESVICHETRFTAYFAAQGFAWDSFVQTEDLKQAFVNPIMACPRFLLEERQCPFFKRRSFFTPFADELRRTDGQSARRLYDYLKEKTDYPVDELLQALLQTAPLSALAQNLHWHFLLPRENSAQKVSLLEPQRITGNRLLQPGQIYYFSLPVRQAGAGAWYEQTLRPEQDILNAAALLFEKNPMLGLLGPALPPYSQMTAERLRQWRGAQPALRQAMQRRGIAVPIDAEQPPPLPTAGCLLLRGAAFPQGLPTLDTPLDWWLLPLLAQQAGYTSATYETPAQAAARADVLEQTLYQAQDARAAIKNVGRILKRTIKNKCEK